MPTNIAKTTKISVIAGIGKNRELGKKNALLWPIPDDLRRFKALTNGHPVIMGLRTHHSIGHPLPNRTNIVMSLEPVEIPGAIVVGNLDEALKQASLAPGGEEVFVMGGGQIYALALPFADKLYLTLIDAEEKKADTFFPDYSMFTKKVFEEHREYNGLKYTWLDLERPEV